MVAVVDVELEEPVLLDPCVLVVEEEPSVAAVLDPPFSDSLHPSATTSESAIRQPIAFFMNLLLG